MQGVKEGNIKGNKDKKYLRTEGGTKGNKENKMKTESEQGNKETRTKRRKVEKQNKNV